MKLIESKAELLLQPAGLEGVYKQIELCGRTCYKSEDRITEDSAKGFVDRMIKSNHTAMLEHGTVYLKMPILNETSYRIDSYKDNPYSKTRIGAMKGNPYYYYIVTNLRVLAEHGWLDDLKYICEPTEYHERRYTLKLTTDRGVSHELVRHRVFSFAQESTRYCNYSKDKFGNELTFIIPSWLTTKIENNSHFKYHKDIDMWQRSEDANTSNFLQSIAWSEDNYLCLLGNGISPQQARQVLPNALKTEICMTGFESDWKHFLDLRYFEVTGKAHPDMKELATKIVEQFKNNNIKIGEI